MSGPYEFQIDRDAGTWTAYNDSGQQIDSGDVPLDDVDKLNAIFADRGVSDPTASALLDYHNENYTTTEVE